LWLYFVLVVSTKTLFRVGVLRPMTMTVIRTAEVPAYARSSVLPLAVGVCVYLLLLFAGNRLLGDPDTQWQITVGRWILAHRMVPQSDIYSFTMAGQSWISTQWLAQVAFALAERGAGWSGPVVLAAGAVAATFALLTKFLSARLTPAATVVVVAGALALTAAHLLARPHVLALPLLVIWVGKLIAAADRGEAPSPWLLPLMALWANLHGGFVFGLALIAPIALDAVWRTPPAARKSLAWRWAAFAFVALAASCTTPYGWNALLASGKILSLGRALPLINEWHPASFSHLGAFEICLLGSLGLALWRGVVLPPLRIVLLLGLLHMALSAARNLEVFALVAPIVLAAPLARQIGGADHEGVARRWTPLHVAAALWMSAATLLIASLEHYAPTDVNSPVAAVTELKRLHVSRVFNDYDFGGYLIFKDVPTFIDGRTELFGEKFVVDDHLASELIEPDRFFRMLKEYDIEATLLRTRSAAAILLDHLDGWQKVYADNIATIHLRRRPGEMRHAEPVISPTGL
jgi:hypothetical protein